MPFVQVPHHTREKEAGAAGLATQAGCMQHRTAQRSPGEGGGIHGRRDAFVSPIQSADGFIIFIIHDSFCCCVNDFVAGGTLRLWPGCLPWGVHPIYRLEQLSDLTTRSNCPILTTDWRLAVKG
jgi:hypothetical protein